MASITGTEGSEAMQLQRAISLSRPGGRIAVSSFSSAFTRELISVLQIILRMPL